LREWQDYYLNPSLDYARSSPIIGESDYPPRPALFPHLPEVRTVTQHDLASRSVRRRASVAAALFVLLVASRVGAADAYPETVRSFVDRHCLACHDASTARAGFRIDQLGTDFAQGNTADLWKEVMDKINSGQMPPKAKPRPDAKEAFAVASWVAGKLRETEAAAQGAGGRVPMRRMNRVEYANTVRDLFSLDDNFARRIEKELPADGKVGGFDRGAAGLFMDEGQLEKYVAVANIVLDDGIFAEQPVVQKLSYDGRTERYVHGLLTAYQDEAGAYVETSVPSVIAKLKEPLSWIPQENFDQYASKNRRYVTHGVYDWEIKNEGVEYLSSSRFYPVEWGRKGVTRDGWYRFRVKAGAFSGADEEAQKDVRLTVKYAEGSPIEALQTRVIDAPLDAPREYEFLMYLQLGPPGMNRSFRVSWDFGDRKEAVIENPVYREVQWKQVIVGGEIARAKSEKKSEQEIELLKKKLETTIAAATESRKTFEGPHWVYNPKLDIAKRPRLWLGKMEWEGPIVDWPPPGRKTLLFAGEDREDDVYLREIFAKFLPLAYRRTVSDEELDRVVDWTLKSKAERGLSFKLAVREGLKNVLCSPKFLYLGSEELLPAAVAELSSASTEPAQASAEAAAAAAEPSPPSAKSPPAAKSSSVPLPSPGPQPIDDWQFASRLSYLLWSSAPDAELYRLAEQNKLRNPAVLRVQVKRMIADPKGREFVRSFAGQWLSVRDFENGNPPNRDFYKFYDDALRDSSKREPLEFFDEVLRQDLPITNFLDSDFLVVNERLARHYGIEGVEGDQFRRVPAPADGRRGGVLGMSGVLTYLADGTRTLPVRRATWVLDTLWNEPVPPPPPNAGDLPANKGKPLSVRARLDEHRRSENCASCHVRVDPFGMALENYDATGMWRDRQNGEGMRGDKYSPALDVSGELPGGVKFTTVQDYKAALVAQKQTFVKGFTEKLLCYALGRPIVYGDHLTVDEIIAAAAKNEYRLQEFVQAIVADRAFQTK
jgi:mono/diheme cytochrome c family protein